MDFFILVGQRIERYPGEYSPEALEVIDEIGNIDNPDFLIEKRAEYKASREFDSLAVMRIRVPDEAITAALYPGVSPIIGDVIVDRSSGNG
jgi:hypothetical protein